MSGMSNVSFQYGSSCTADAEHYIYLDEPMENFLAVWHVGGDFGWYGCGVCLLITLVFHLVEIEVVCFVSFCGRLAILW